VDFWDPDDACPKHNFPLPVAELMINASTSHKAFSFKDFTASYNKTHMALEDQDATEFRTLKDIFFYKILSLDLKNMGAPNLWEIANVLTKDESL